MAVEKKKLTKRTIDCSPPQTKRYILWDKELTGFGLRIFPTGRKVFFIQYRNKHGEQKWFNLGQYGHLTPDQARQRAFYHLSKIAEGHDPSEDKGLHLKELTVAALCDLYILEGCKHKKASTIKTDHGRIECHIKPLLGAKKISALKRKDIEQMMHDIAEGKTKADTKPVKKHARSIVRGGKVSGSRGVSLLSAIYSFAIKRELTKDNPCKSIKLFPSKSCKRYLSQKEFKDLADALFQAEQEGENLSATNIIRMLVFTGCRKSEIQTLKWEYIDWNNSAIQLPDSKTGAKVIRLGAPAIAVLKSQVRIKDNSYVFHGLKPKSFYVGLAKAWGRIKARNSGLHDVRLHDLRHSFASVGVAEGHSLMFIGALLGHSNPNTTLRYAHISDDPLKVVNSDISNKIEGYMLGNKVG